MEDTTTTTTTTTEALDVSAVADAVASAVSVPPPPLPTGWLLKESRSQPDTYYYYNLETGANSWHPPIDANMIKATLDGATKNHILENETLTATTSTTTSTTNLPHDASSSNLLPPPDPDPGESSSTVPDRGDGGVDDSDEQQHASKRRKTTTTGAGGAPTQVRVLHILKKHKDSRRPASWRQSVITQTLEESREEIQGLLEILQEESSPEELQATFEELARTESDCSSAKRGGDLGFFGRRKMQPAFETASFALEIGELTKELVETSSGVHILLRIG